MPKGCLRSHRNFIMAASVLMMEIPLLRRRQRDHRQSAGGGHGDLAAHHVHSQRHPHRDAGAVRAGAIPGHREPGKADPALHDGHDDAALFRAAAIRRHGFHNRCASITAAAREIIEQLHANPSFHAGFSFGYASSEAGGLVTFRLPIHYRLALDQPEKYDYLLDSAGTEAPLTRVECLDDDLKPVPQGEIGELAVSGPSVFRGYWERPEETVKVLRDGWLLTGDLALKDKDGVIFIKGRKREMIKTGGVNVYPAEIEPVLESHEQVVEAAVVGIPDKEWGEKVVAFVIAKSKIGETELIDYCRDKLAAYKRPKQIVFVDEFPMTRRQGDKT